MSTVMILSSECKIMSESEVELKELKLTSLHPDLSSVGGGKVKSKVFGARYHSAGC